MTDKGFLDKVAGKVKEVASDISDDGKKALDKAVEKAKEIAEDINETKENLIDKAKNHLPK